MYYLFTCVEESAKFYTTISENRCKIIVTFWTPQYKSKKKKILDSQTRVKSN